MIPTNSAEFRQIFYDSDKFFMIPTEFRRKSVGICRSPSESTNLSESLINLSESTKNPKSDGVRPKSVGIRRNPIGVLLKLNVQIPVGVTMIPVGIRRNQKNYFFKFFDSDGIPIGIAQIPRNKWAYFTIPTNLKNAQIIPIGIPSESLNSAAESKLS
jgi:hypothetical protein